MRLLPLRDGLADGPEPLADPGRGCVVVYWQEPPPQPTVRVHRRRAPVTRASWTQQAVRFEALGLGSPPRSPEELARAARLGFAFAASYHPIPSTADVYYEVRV
jgi:hypothetical protein